VEQPALLQEFIDSGEDVNSQSRAFLVYVFT
jgi:hypothetical protein